MSAAWFRIGMAEMMKNGRQPCDAAYGPLMRCLELNPNHAGAHCGLGLSGSTGTGTLVAWDGSSDVPCPTPSGSPVTLDGGSYSVSVSLFPSGEDTASHCGSTEVDIDGDVTVTIELGDCE